MKKIIFTALSLSLIVAAYAVSDVNVLSLKGPLGTRQISPPNGSTTSYLMNYAGQKSICFQSASDTEVYIGSYTISNSNGYGLMTKGSSVCLDLLGGTTVYFYGNGAGADVRAIFIR